MKKEAYLQLPSIYHDTIVFSTDDDIWKVALYGGNASRLTTSKGISHHPHISPDGKHIAFLSNDQGMQSVYLIDADGGESKRISYNSVQGICNWKDNQNLIICSSSGSFYPDVGQLFLLNINTLEQTKIDVGPAKTISFSGQKTVLGRNTGDPARWKRYKGGTAGTLWVSTGKNIKYKKILSKFKTNLGCPLFINERIFFISDHQGIGNIYSTNTNGTSIKRHTHHNDYYVRNISCHNKTIVYQKGGDIYSLDLVDNINKKINIVVKSSFNQAIPRFESASKFLQDFSISENAQLLAISVRGKVFVMPPWSKAPISLGKDNLRYKCPRFLPKQKIPKLIIVELNSDNEETLVLYNLKTIKPSRICTNKKWGKILSLTPSNNGKYLSLTNNRNELWLINLKSNNCKKIDNCSYSDIDDISWSNDDQLMTYSKKINTKQQAIIIYNIKNREKREIIRSILNDYSPSFDPEGKFLYFIGVREFYPIDDETHFEFSFPNASKIYSINLTKNTLPISQMNLDFQDEKKEDDNTEDKKIRNTKIDLDNIDHRISSLPSIDIGRYLKVLAIKEHILYLKAATNKHSKFDISFSYNLFLYSIKTKKEECLAEDIISFELSYDGKHILTLNSDNELRLIKSTSKASSGNDYNKKDGWIDLERISLYINPRNEWRQMYKEAWILQREQFWTADMSGVNWKSIYNKYLPIVKKINTRYELSDVLWEMQGELGTSHCYEFSGDYNRKPPININGLLGAKINYNTNNKNFTIEDIYRGDSWIDGCDSPLSTPGVAINKGDVILSIDGKDLKKYQDLYINLMGKAAMNINLKIKRKNGKIEDVVIKTLSSENKLLYRQWVNKNKEYVHKKTRGKIGYIHIPDMGIWGFSEFYRNFLSESQKDGLIVDVRYNGGGFISQLLLKTLAQKILGFDVSRHYGIKTYPEYAINSIVCLTNELSGSDGDIFSHSFKLMKLGKLIGKRTWGGVIGIWPRHFLNDGSITTQPEYAFWFKDVGFNVENYGTDPDIEIEITPEDWKNGVDPQMDKAISTVLNELPKKTLKPNFKRRPSRKIPTLPKN